MEVVEVPYCHLGIRRDPVANVTVRPVGSTELDHQPQLEDSPAGGEHGDELVLKAVPGDPVAVDLGALGRMRPGVVGVTVDFLPVLLMNDEAGLFKELLVLPCNLLLI